MISDSYLQAAHTVCGDGNDATVIVKGEILIKITVSNNDLPKSFDVDLGQLTKGDVVYVASGPGGTDQCDMFVWDFSITSVPEVSQSPARQLLAPPAPACNLRLLCGLFLPVNCACLQSQGQFFEALSQGIAGGRDHQRENPKPPN